MSALPHLIEDLEDEMEPDFDDFLKPGEEPDNDDGGYDERDYADDEDYLDDDYLDD